MLDTGISRVTSYLYKGVFILCVTGSIVSLMASEGSYLV